MSESALIGIDLGKHTFHLHGQDTSARSPPACWLWKWAMVNSIDAVVTLPPLLA